MADVKFFRGDLADVGTIPRADGQVIYCLDSTENCYCQYVDYLDDNNVVQRVKVTDTELKNYVSDGKSLVANAITNKGVTTSPTASFSTMATNIGRIEGGGTVEVSPTIDMTGKAHIADDEIETFKCVTVEPYYGLDVVEDSLAYYGSAYPSTYPEISEYSSSPCIKQALFPPDGNNVKSAICNFTTNNIGTGSVMARELKMRGGKTVPLAGSDKVTTTYTTAVFRYSGAFSKALRDTIYDLIMSHEVGQSTNPYDSTLPFVSKFSSIEKGETVTATDAPYKVEEDVDTYGLSIAGINMIFDCRINAVDSSLYAKNNKTSTSTYTRLRIHIIFKDYYYAALGASSVIRSDYWWREYVASIPYSELDYSNGRVPVYLRNKFHIMGQKDGDFCISISPNNTNEKKLFMQFYRQKPSENCLDIIDGYSFNGNGGQRYANGGGGEDRSFMVGFLAQGPFSSDGYFQLGVQTPHNTTYSQKADIYTSTFSNRKKVMIERYYYYVGSLGTGGSLDYYGSYTTQAMVFTSGMYIGSQYLFKAYNYYKLNNDIYYCYEDGVLIKVKEGVSE